MRQIFHRWEKWECVPAGLFNTRPPSGLTPETAKNAYRDFLADPVKFSQAIERVFREWPLSCEQFLTNQNINRLAWIGQSAMCIETGVSHNYRGGFKRLSREKQNQANAVAKEYLLRWLSNHGANQKEDRGIFGDMGEAWI